MNTKLTVALLASLAMLIWTGRVFFHTMDGDILWKKMISGVGFLVFLILFILVAVQIRKVYRTKED